MVEKEPRRVVVTDVAIPAESNMRKKDQEKMVKYKGAERVARTDVEDESQSGPGRDRSMRDCDPQTGLVITGTTCEVSSGVWFYKQLIYCTELSNYQASG